MSFREPKRMRLLLREAGAGWILALPVMELIQLAGLGGLSERGRFVYSPNAMLLAGVVPMAMAIWTIVGQYHAKLLLSASELRAPRVLRTLCLTSSGFAALTVFELLAPIVVLHGPYLQWLLFIFFAVCAGVLIALFRGTWFETPIWLSAIAVDMHASMGSSVVYTKWVECLALTLPFLIAWRLRMLLRALHAGTHGDLLRSLAAERSIMTAKWSAHSRATAKPGASADVWRVSLGPLYERRASWILLCFAPALIMIALAPQPYTVAFAKLLTTPLFVSLPFLCGIMGVMFLQARVRRLADLLLDPSGEIADLALLPGLGDHWLLRRALLRETLVPPLFYYGLCLAGLVGSCWVLLRLGQSQIDPILFLVVPPSALLLLFATLTVGVLSGRLGRDSGWFNGSILFLVPPTFLSMFAGLGTQRPHQWTANLPTWLSIVWMIVLSVMAACLVRWALQLTRRPNLLCQ